MCAGNELEVVPGGEFAGCLLATQHRYFLGGGSYDWYYLLRPNGKEVGVVGDDTEIFHATYVKSSAGTPPPEKPPASPPPTP